MKLINEIVNTYSFIFILQWSRRGISHPLRIWCCLLFTMRFWCRRANDFHWNNAIYDPKLSKLSKLIHTDSTGSKTLKSIECERSLTEFKICKIWIWIKEGGITIGKKLWINEMKCIWLSESVQFSSVQFSSAQLSLVSVESV